MYSTSISSFMTSAQKYVKITITLIIWDLKNGNENQTTMGSELLGFSFTKISLSPKFKW